MRSICLNLPCLFWFFAGPILGQGLQIGEIVSRFLEKAEADSAHVGENYTHYEREITVDFKDGVAAKRREEQYFVEKRKSQDGARLYRTLVLSDGLPPKKQSVEAKENTLEINRRLLDRYDFNLSAEEVLDGQACWVFSFKPKSGYPEKQKLDRILNNLFGDVWILKDGFVFKKLVFHLTNDIEYAWPSFTGGNAKKVEGLVKAMVLDGHFAVSLVQVEYQYSARAFFFPINGHSMKTIFYENYRRKKEDK